MNISLGMSMINGQMIPFYPSTLQAFSTGIYFIPAFQDLSIPWVPQFAICSGM